MKAILKNYRQSPRKVRLVANMIKGKKASDARVELSFLVKRAALPFAKLLDSALSNAKIAGKNPEDLFVKNVTVDSGVTLKRRMPRARGSAYLIRKKSSHILLTLTEENPKKTKKTVKKEESKEEKVAPKKKVVKKVTKSKKTEDK